ncbi:MAG: helix-turn-helix domain-containing protein [Candidatus Omnitrophota bacterium]|nr:helix-turn-helix domain-containing protein [Candidatus Omnitrophota bacterium]
MTKADVLTADQIAEVLGISRNTIQRPSWREKTGCPLKKIGRRLYITEIDFQKWLKA